MEKIRVAGIIPMEVGIALMHRVGVLKQKEYQDYYTFPGGGLEENETTEEGTIREIQEELGIKVRIVRKMYEIYSEKFQQREIFYLCEYIEGEFGTGNGPEFSNNPQYVNSGKYIPEIIEKEKLSEILLLPKEIKDKLLVDLT